MLDRLITVNWRGEGNRVRFVAVRFDTVGRVGACEGVVVSGPCPCFSAGVWGIGVGGGCLGCVRGRHACL